MRNTEEGQKLKEQLQAILNEGQPNEILINQFLKDTAHKKPPLIFLTYEEKLEILHKILKKNQVGFLKIFSGNNIGFKYFMSSDLDQIITDYKDKDNIIRKEITEFVQYFKETNIDYLYCLKYSKSLTRLASYKITKNQIFKEALKDKMFWPNQIPSWGDLDTAGNSVFHNTFISSFDSIDVKYVQQMIELGANVNFRYHTYQAIYTPIISASQNSRCSAEIVKALIAAGADVNFRNSGKHFSSALQITDPKKIDLLLKAGAVPTQKELELNKVLAKRYDKFLAQQSKGSDENSNKQTLLIATIVIIAISIFAFALACRFTKLGNKIKTIAQNILNIKNVKVSSNVPVKSAVRLGMPKSKTRMGFHS